ncbi:hypothetical protein GOP47_0013274 [Adiantum capillus-veneris]|uniref:Protein SPT2 homolog n=1 Tax=Adiantum capillus-veneris TaxID=13818 RepID=A0A9D4UN65_ADICA|nr:hypothetical protein GOP47_0013274 [Adiantum capillus-veneris]
MGRPERMEHYRDERDYGNLLDEDYGDEYEEKQDLAEPLQREEENYSQECQEYYERRERLKELERQRFRRLSDNGKSISKSTRKPLPYDNYGSFFGPSEPIVTKRIIADVRARETASKVAARQAQEVSEPQRVSKGSSGMVSESRVVETAKPSKGVNEQALKLQRLKEARDYSFLFTDKDPTASPPCDEARSITKERQDNNRTKHIPSSAKGASGQPPRGPNSAKPLASISAKASMESKAVAPKAQERQSAPTAKSSKLPERPPVLKSKVLFQSGSISNLNKTISGPGRPAQAQQARPSVSMAGLSNGKKPLSSAVASQLRSLVAPAPKGASTLSVPSTSAKPAPGKGPPLKSAPFGSVEKKLPQLPGSKSQLSTASRPDQKRPGVTAGRGVSTHHDQRRPLPTQAAASQKMKSKPLPSKRSWESESEDSFLDDDDDGGDYRSAIRKMFGYNPNKYRDIDDEDDRAMEANFHTIQMEEKRSARIAREEDERELALIEEEERREREMARKRRKQQR